MADLIFARYKANKKSDLLQRRMPLKQVCLFIAKRPAEVGYGINLCVGAKLFN